MHAYHSSLASCATSAPVFRANFYTRNIESFEEKLPSWAHRAPIPEEEPVPGDEPEPQDDPIPDHDPIVREPGVAEPLTLQISN
jgi:hypothetical protein